MQRVIICYFADEADELAELLGIERDELEKKVVYHLAELKKC